jgi:hypothetical protein
VIGIAGLTAGCLTSSPDKSGYSACMTGTTCPPTLWLQWVKQDLQDFFSVLPVADYDPVLVELYLQLLFFTPFKLPDILDGYGNRITGAAGYLRQTPDVPLFNFSSCHMRDYFSIKILRLIMRNKF